MIFDVQFKYSFQMFLFKNQVKLTHLQYCHLKLLTKETIIEEQLIVFICHLPLTFNLFDKHNFYG